MSMMLFNVERLGVAMLASEIIYQVLGPHFNDRVAPHPIPEKFDMATTYITYQSISNMPLSILDGWTGHDQVRMQVNIYNSDNVQCERDAIQVKWAMDQQRLAGCELLDQSDGGFDADTQLYCQQIDFYIWQSAC